MTAPCAVCQVADGCHCLPLFPAVQGCGCPVGDGHRCPPPWVDEWPDVGTDNGFRTNRAVESGSKKCPEPASTDPGLPTNLITQEGDHPMLSADPPTPPEIGGK